MRRWPVLSEPLRSKAEYAETYYNRGLVLKDLNRPDAALASFERALALKADFAEAHFNRGNVLRDLDQRMRPRQLRPGHWAQGRLCRSPLQPWRRAQGSQSTGCGLGELRPGHRARCRLCPGVFQSRHCLEGPQTIDRGLGKLRPGHRARCRLCRGPLRSRQRLENLNQLDAALASYDRAIAVKPDYADAYYNRSLLLLLKGDFARGWADYEWRWKSKSLPTFKGRRDFGQPLWLGKEPIAGKTILLHGEQGLGDTLQFCRYVKLVADLGGRAILEVPSPLVKLLEGLVGAIANCREGKRAAQLSITTVHC